MTVLLYQQRSADVASAWAGLLPEPPLLEIAGKPLLAWHLEKLAEAGFEHAVVSIPDPSGEVARLVGDGSRFGLAIDRFDPGDETRTGLDAMLATRARPFDEPVVAISADLWTDYDFARLPRRLHASAHLVLVDNTAYHPHGDLALLPDGHVRRGRGMKLTFAGIGVYSPALLATVAAPVDAPRLGNPLMDVLPMLAPALAAGAVNGEHYIGPWTHVTCPDRLWDLDGVLEL